MNAEEAPRGFGLPPGSHLGRYQIVRGLARGGMGEVYLGRMPTAGGDKLVAIKRMLPTHMDDPAVRAMFVAETRLALRLDHSGVVSVLDVIELSGEHAIVMEYVHGRSARDLVRAWAKQPPATVGPAVAVIMGAAHALHYAHEERDAEGRPMGLVHRDVSPENIMVRFDGGTRLIDFGIARITAHTAATTAGVLKGKVGYMSPEQIRQDPLDRRSDVYQLGIVLYEMTTGHRAFSGDNFAAVMNAVLSGDVPSPRDRVPEYPAALEAIVERALAYEPEDRYGSAQAFNRALATYAEQAGLNVGEETTADEMRRLFGAPAPPKTEPGGAAPGTDARRDRRSARGATVVVVGAALVAAAAGAAVPAWAAHRDAHAAVTERAALSAHERFERWTIAASSGGTLGLLLLGIAAWRRRRTRAAAQVAAVSIGIGSTACAPPELPCTDAAPCDLRPVDGICDAIALRCSYPDDDCASGRRLSVLAGEEASQCAPADPGDDRTRIAWPIDTAVALDGDPRELKLGAPLRLSSTFGVHADLWLRYDDSGLFVGAEVTDPQVEATRRPHEPLWDEDGLEILFDTAWDRSEGSMPAADDFKIVVTAINVTSVSWGGVVPRTAWSMPIRSAVVVDGTPNQSADQDRGYTLELFVPWSNEIPKPEPGTAWGLNVRINDHDAGSKRALTWRQDARFNHPSGAGVLAFAAPQRVPEALTPGRAPRNAGPPFRALPLAEHRVDDSGNFDSAQPVAGLFDGCLATRERCAAGTDSGDAFTVRFDLGSEFELSHARLFGDTQHEWVSRSWGLRTRRHEGEAWRWAFERADAHTDGWVHAALPTIAARHIEVVVRGDAGKGAEAVELEIYGRPRASANR